MELIVCHGEREEEVHLDRRDDGTYAVTLDDKTYVLDVEVAAGGSILSLIVDDGRQFEVAVRKLKHRGHARYEVSSSRGVDTIEVTDPLTRLAELASGDSGGKKLVSAYMPGRVVELLVAEGDEVEKGQGVLVLEAMKMKNEISSESDGRVARVFVDVDQNVEGGDPLFEID